MEGKVGGGWGIRVGWGNLRILGILLFLADGWSLSIDLLSINERICANDVKIMGFLGVRFWLSR